MGRRRRRKKKKEEEKKKKKKKEEEEAVNAYLIKNSRWGRGVLPQAVGRIGRSIMSRSILCNYFKVCTKFTLEGAE